MAKTFSKDLSSEVCSWPIIKKLLVSVLLDALIL